MLSGSTARITLVAHTHWDREWYEPFEVFRAHLVEMLDEALDDLERDPQLSFTLDGHVALVDDYLDVRPQAEPRIRELVKSGRLHIGPWFTQADTLLADGESLIRNLALGIRRAEELGGAMRLGYMPDQFGHAAQIPQILRLFDIDGAVLWRGVGPERPPHAFRWVSPDGSEVTALWLQDGYGSGRRFPSDPKGFADAVDRHIERIGDWLGEMPVLVPVGDDHVKLAAWLPSAAAEVRARRPGMVVNIGGYQDHLPHVGPLVHVHRGELRSPSFAPVLAGVASARVREKQAGAHVATLLERYAEPLVAWAATVGPTPTSAHHLITRAWRQLLLNHAHDSVAGCGIDAAHEDVRTRYRWAEQLARSACEQALARVQVAGTLPGGATVAAFHAGPSAAAALIETHVPRALGVDLESIGADGITRPVQLLGELDDRPIFEGEFSAADLGQYLGGLDPKTPLFGKYLTGITIGPESEGLVRLDVGLGDTPIPASRLVDDQRRVSELCASAVRFKVVLHASGAARPALVQAGPAPEAGFVLAGIRSGSGDADVPRVTVQEQDDLPSMSTGTLRVAVELDGTVRISDSALPLAPVLVNDLVDEGDRGDLYHCDPVGDPIRALSATATVLERGPLRGRIRIVQDLELPLALDLSRQTRSATTRRTTITTDVSLTAGERRVELTTSFDNASGDHRLRALVHVPLRAERLDVEHGLTVIARPLDPLATLGSGSERAAPTGQHHGFVDLSHGKAGVALISRGLVEHEAITSHRDCTCLALTLLRSVGWLSRGDLSVIDHAAGPMMATPGAQEMGAHRFEYAVLLHEGDWRRGQVPAESRRFLAPPMAVTLKGSAQVPAAAPLVAIEPASVVISALHRSERGGGVVVRLVNLSPERADASLRAARQLGAAFAVDPMERPIDHLSVERVGDQVRVSLEPWQIATLALRWEVS